MKSLAVMEMYVTVCGDDCKAARWHKFQLT